MTLDPNAAAMQRYHDHFDAAQYHTIGEFLASNLNADSDDERVVALLNAVQHAAFELCGHPLHAGAWHALAVRCGQHFLSLRAIDAMRDFLRSFAPDDGRIDDFEATATAMLQAYSGLDDLKTAAVHAHGVHSWQGRMAYELLAAVDYLTQTATQMLAHGSDQGLQYACQDYIDLLKETHVQISMAAVGKPEENGFAEQLMRTIREEEVDLNEYHDFHDAYQRIGRFLDDLYTRKRIHSALGYLTPAEFEENWLAQQQESVLK